jgi:UDP-N-acetylmuramate dehydrogenase
MHLVRNVCLKKYTTIGSGGSAHYLTQVTNLEQLKETFLFCGHEDLPFVSLGKGSNTIFDDRGFAGVVIINKMQNIIWHQHTVTIDSGYSFSHLGVLAAKKNYTGLEFAAGIPASVGGAVYMNAGANGQQTQDSLASVTFMHPDGSIQKFDKENCNFGYRHSIFHKLKGCILSADFSLKPSLDARAKQLEIIAYRTKTQPYGDKSAGCFFKNPEEKSAGALIEELGLKGFSMGGASVSNLHANFIINHASASTQDLFKLASYVQKKVLEEKGIVLEMEVRKIPFEGER